MQEKPISKFLSATVAVLVVCVCVTLSGCTGSTVNYVCNHDTADSSTIDIEALYQIYKTEYPDGTYEDFVISLGLSVYTSEYATSVGIKSVVSIYGTFTRNTTRPGQTAEYGSGGAGIVYKVDGDDVYIMTNYHIVYDSASNASNKIAHTIKVYCYGHENTDEAIDAEFIGGSLEEDIAVLKVSVSDFTCTVVTAQMADLDDLVMGERVIAIGNPLGEGIAATIGIVSVVSEEITMEALDSASKTITLNVIRTDAAINSGNSGGGLFNIKGQLVGIVNAKTVQSGVENMGYAIPINAAVSIADGIISK